MFNGGSLDDQFHAYTATWVSGMPHNPVWNFEDTTNLMCNPMTTYSEYPFVHNGKLMFDVLQLPTDSVPTDQFNHRLDMWIYP